MAVKRMLTTEDNPYNPFIDWWDWYRYDEASGYFSTALLARILVTSDELSEKDQEIAYEHAVDEIVRENASGIHKFAYPDDPSIGSGEY